MAAGNILIVDDEDFILNLLSNGLTGGGFNVKTAKNGFEALVAVESDRPELIITDIMMPKLSGLELLEALKGNKDTRDIPVILISALDQADTVQQGLDLGANDYITKPFKMSEVIGKVRHYSGQPQDTDG
jgi:DNA-binding response OmpR family regulator